MGSTVATEVFLTRLEYLTPDGWHVGHAAVNLLDPEAYVKRLSARGKFGRATILDDRLQPRGKVYTSPNIPEDLSVLAPDAPSPIPKVAEPGAQPVACPHCDEVHHAPFDGSCLI